MCSQSGARLEILKSFGSKLLISPGNLTLDLYRAKNSSGRVPVVVLIYDGAWMMPNPGMEVPKARSAGNPRLHGWRD
jgi:hypothetical protein